METVIEFGGDAQRLHKLQNTYWALIFGRDIQVERKQNA